MSKSSRQILEEIYNDMMVANRKAEEASYKWNLRAKEITDHWTKKGKDANKDQIFIDEDIRSKKESDYELTSHWSTYSFYKGEVERYSTLLQGIAAFKQVRSLGIVPTPPSGAVNFQPR